MNIKHLKKKRIPKGYMDVIGATQLVGPILFPDEWATHEFMGQLPFIKIVKIKGSHQRIKCRKHFWQKHESKLIFKEYYTEHTLTKEEFESFKRAGAMFGKIINWISDELFVGTIKALVLGREGNPINIPRGLIVKRGNFIFSTGYSLNEEAKGRILFDQELLQKAANKLGNQKIDSKAISADAQARLGKYLLELIHTESLTASEYIHKIYEHEGKKYSLREIRKKVWKVYAPKELQIGGRPPSEKSISLRKTIS